MHQVYVELGELINAIDTPWFDSTLPAVIQCVFDYDYFLLAHYEKNQPLKIERSDFLEVEMRETLNYLVTETYLAEPIYRLFNAEKTQPGVYDMRELVTKSLALPEPLDLSSPHFVVDGIEEIGWRTTGWPEYQQETCILVPIDETHLMSVSLFNFRLSTKAPTTVDQLVTIYPAISKAILRHFQLREKNLKLENAINNDSDLNFFNGNIIQSDDVIRFFKSEFRVSITLREAEIFNALLRGKTLSAVAKALGISINTARTHRRNVYRKIGHGRLPELINQFHIHLVKSDIAARPIKR